ncbi:MAG: hypothetical protein QOF68_2237 [Gaiellales bacterium]|nr:hypothetical protein [Gaiellales bacterium]
MEAAISLDRAGRLAAPRVLIVGAEPIVREWVQYKHSEHGFEFEQAVDLPDALRVIEGGEPDAILVDPDGYNGQGEMLVPALCESAPASAVVVLSERSDGGAVNRAIRAGARGYLSKASTNVDLADTLRTVMSGVLTLDQSSLRSLVDPATVEPTTGTGTLSVQELKVLNLVAEGLTNREIGARLYLSPHTVKNYLRNAADKLGVATRLDAVLEASRRGLIELPPQSGRSRSVRRHAQNTLYAFPNVWAVLSESLPVLSLSA